MRASPGEALYSAARNGDVDALRRLLADAPDAMDWRHPRNRGQTALFTASKYGRTTCVALLLEKGANAHLASDGLCPIHVGCAEGKSGPVEALVAAGCDVNLPTQDDVHLTPLYMAALDGRAAVVKVLLQRGAIPSLTDANGFTPLMAACAGNHVAAARMLIDADAPIEQATLADGFTALHVAAMNNKVDALRVLLDNCVDFDRTTKAGKTALDLATEMHQTAARDFLSNPPPMPRLPRWRPAVHKLYPRVFRTMAKQLLLAMVRLRQNELRYMHRDIVLIMVRHLATHYSSSDGIE